MHFCVIPRRPIFGGSSYYLSEGYSQCIISLIDRMRNELWSFYKKWLKNRDEEKYFRLLAINAGITDKENRVIIRLFFFCAFFIQCKIPWRGNQKKYLKVFYSIKWECSSLRRHTCHLKHTYILIQLHRHTTYSPSQYKISFSWQNVARHFVNILTGDKR